MVKVYLCIINHKHVALFSNRNNCILYWQHPKCSRDISSPIFTKMISFTFGSCAQSAGSLCIVYLCICLLVCLLVLSNVVVSQDEVHNVIKRNTIFGIHHQEGWISSFNILLIVSLIEISKRSIYIH